MPISYKSSLMVPVLVCVALAFSGEVSAEGRCPLGQYPIGDSRAPGCAPIPAGGGGAAEGPRATGRWIKTWGAIATSSTGASLVRLRNQTPQRMQFLNVLAQGRVIAEFRLPTRISALRRLFLALEHLGLALAVQPRKSLPKA